MIKVIYITTTLYRCQCCEGRKTRGSNQSKQSNQFQMTAKGTGRGANASNLSPLAPSALTLTSNCEGRKTRGLNQSNQLNRGTKPSILSWKQQEATKGCKDCGRCQFLHSGAHHRLLNCRACWADWCAVHPPDVSPRAGFRIHLRPRGRNG